MLNEKIQSEEKIAKVEQVATGWLEPCKEFLEAAHNAGKLIAEENLEAQKLFALKIGSNHRLAAKSLVFDFNSPWLHLAAAHTESAGGGICDHIRKIGSNFRLAAKSLHFDYGLPWRIIERWAATAPVFDLRPQGDSNPCYRRERAVS